jgi:hypothetical protein
MKSVHAHTNEKSATVATAGFDIGATSRHRIAHSLQPSSRAASINSCGSVRKNWRSIKIRNAFPKNAGTISGRKVSTQPSVRNSKNTGSSVTCGGSISVLSITQNQKPRPRQRSRANA